MELIPELVQHVNARLVLGNPEDELCGLSGRQDALGPPAGGKTENKRRKVYRE